MSNTIQSVLGFDHGARKIGVAIGQAITQTASPLENISTKKPQQMWASIQTLIRHWQPDALIVGIPWRSDGSASHSTEAALQFAQQLERRFALPVHQIDETLSSQAANELMSDDTFQQAPLDAVAAKIIIETWFSSHS